MNQFIAVSAMASNEPANRLIYYSFNVNSLNMLLPKYFADFPDTDDVFFMVLFMYYFIIIELVNW